jgi:signal transduction histidine kinase
VIFLLNKKINAGMQSGQLYLNQVLILVGAAIMLLSIFHTRNILIHVKGNKYHRRWKALLGLMVFFLAGYIGSFFIVRTGNERVFYLLTGVVFLFGSLFVYIVSRTGYATIKDLGDSLSQLQYSVGTQQKLEDELNKNKDSLSRQNSALLFLAKNVLKRSSLDLSIQLISEKTAEIMDGDRVSIWALNKERSYMECLDFFERSKNEHKTQERLNTKDYPAYFTTLENNGVIDAYDAHTDSRTMEFASTYFHPLGISSTLDAPIHLDGKLKGVICIEQYNEKRQWAIEEKSFITAIADLIAITIETFERRKTEKELELSLSLTKATIESTADGILVVGNDGKISGYNRQFVKMWRIPDTVIEAKDDAKAISFVISQLKNQDAFLAKVKELYTHPRKESFDILEFHDGRTFERYSKPQVAGNEVIGRVWSFRDVTKRRQIEEEVHKLNTDLENRVRQRTMEVLDLNKELKINIQNLEAANQELESFSYSVSHDLRAPLRAINGFISILEKRYTQTLGPDGVKYMDIISGNAKKMGQLIDDLLAFSRLGRKELVKVDIDVKELVIGLLKEINITEWNPKTKVVIGNLLPVTGDESLLKQAFFNLITNAIKYSRVKEEPLIEISSYTSGNENIYYVKDNGVGFNMEYYNKLFKVFQRIHSASEFEGIGVGLAIVSRIIVRHNGHVWAEGKVDEGATFYMALPNDTFEDDISGVGLS